jgi:hypothetical protein
MDPDRHSRRYLLTFPVACTAILFTAAVNVADAQPLGNSESLPPKLLLNPPQEDMGKQLSRGQVKTCMKRAAEISEHDK